MMIGIPLSNALKSNVPSIAIALIVTATFVVFSTRVGMFRCPHCGERFTIRKVGWIRYSNPLTSECLNCAYPNI